MSAVVASVQAEVEWAKNWFRDNRDSLIAYITESCSFLEHDYIKVATMHLWNRLVDRLAKEHGIDRDTAEQHQAAGLAFLRSGRQNPTAFEDVGWHNLLHYTAEYPAVCQVLVGHYVHHLPNDVPGFNMEAAGCDNGTSCANNCRGTGGS